MRLNASLAMAARGSGGDQMLQRVRRLLGLVDEPPRGNARAVPAVLLFALALGTIAFHAARRVAAADPAALPAAPGRPATTRPAGENRSYMVTCRLTQTRSGATKILAAPSLLLVEGREGEVSIEGTLALGGPMPSR